MLTSKYNIDDVDYCDFLPNDPSEVQKYKYYCPICLRYFSQILISSCCTNYICICCINDLQEQERKDPKFKATCPFGCQHTNGAKLVIMDVDPESKVKKYSDSQDVQSLKPISQNERDRQTKLNKL